MIMDEKGKVFGRISIIDICALLVLLALLAGAYYRFYRVDPQHTAANFDTIEYKVLMKEVRQQSIDAVETGAEVYDVRTDSYMGKIVRKDIAPSMAIVTKSDGTVAMAEKPERFDVLVTITVPGVESEFGFLANGKRDLNRESMQVLKTQKIIMEAKIADVRNLSK